MNVESPSSPKRITPDMVLEAYRKTGLKPSRGNVVIHNNRCCPIGALAAAQGKVAENSIGSNCYTFVESYYGLEVGYVGLFWHGFDGFKSSNDRSQGYQDGMACAKAVGL